MRRIVLGLASIVAILSPPALADSPFAFNVPRDWHKQEANGQQNFTAPTGDEGVSITSAPWLGSDQAPSTVLARLVAQYQLRYPDLRVMTACKVSPTLASATFSRGDPKGPVSERLIVSTGQGAPKISVNWAPADRFARDDLKLVGIQACPRLEADAPSQTAPVFETWRDPMEGAFTVSVPKDWAVTGGMRRPSPLDPRPSVVLHSPDGALTVFMGDASIGTFEVPDPIRARMGYGEGKTIPAGPNSPMAITIRRYMPGDQLAEAYIRGQCRDARLVDRKDLPEEGRDLANGVQEANPGTPARVMGRAAALTFECGGKQGLVEAGTVLAGPPSGQGIFVWSVPLLAGYAGDPAQAQLGNGVMNTLVASFKYDPSWEQKFNANARGTAGKVIGEQNAVLRGVQARASQEASSSLNHPNTFTPHSGVVTPADTSGNKTMCSALDACQSVSTDHTYYWINNSQEIVPGKETGEPPDNSGNWYRTEQR
jgi:hypothetical protein